MKRLFISALALGMTSFAFAQKNTVLVGGNVGFESTKNNASDSKTNSFNVNPFVGYQFTDNWTAGVVGIAEFSKQEPFGSFDNRQVSKFGGGPFIRYTKELSNIFSVFGQLQGTFAGGNVKTENTVGGSTISTETKTSYLNARLFPAVFVNVSKGFGLNLDFGGVYFDQTKPKNVDATNTIGFNFGRTVNIGISKNF